MIDLARHFESLKFNEKNHSYTLGNRSLKSVTQKISSLKPYTDWDAVALKCSKNEKHEHFGKDLDEIRAIWKQSGIDSMRKGTIVHNYIEHRLLGKPYQIYDTDWLPEMSAWEAWWNYHKKYLSPVASELKVADARLGVAGTIDSIFWDKRVEKYRIGDWKTGKRFRTENIFQQYKVPFDVYEECEFHTYSMQVSLYRLIMEVNISDLEFDDPFIVWVKNDGTWQEHRALDFRDRLNHWLTGDEF